MATKRRVSKNEYRFSSEEKERQTLYHNGELTFKDESFDVRVEKFYEMVDRIRFGMEKADELGFDVTHLTISFEAEPPKAKRAKKIKIK